MISNVSSQSGKMYCSIKDERANSETMQSLNKQRQWKVTLLKISKYRNFEYMTERSDKH